MRKTKKGKIDINIKQDKNKKIGSVLVENILMIAITLVLIIVIFYPQIIKLFNKVMDSLSIWFDNAVSVIGVIN